jgi:hypothetical protein
MSQHLVCRDPPSLSKFFSALQYHLLRPCGTALYVILEQVFYLQVRLQMHSFNLSVSLTRHGEILKLARCCGSLPEPHAARHMFNLAAEVACKTPTHIVTPPSFCIRDAVERFMPLLPKTIHDSKEGRHVIFWSFVPQPSLLCGVIRKLRNTLNTQVSTRVLPTSSHQCVFA